MEKPLKSIRVRRNMLAAEQGILFEKIIQVVFMAIPAIIDNPRRQTNFDKLVKEGLADTDVC